MPAEVGERNGVQHALDEENLTTGQKSETALPDPMPVLRPV
jgi:hypothetical protein